MMRDSIKKFIKEYALVIIAVSVLPAFGIPYSIHEARVKNENYAILNNPTFVGEVVDKEIRRINITQLLSHNQYRLYLVGHYLENDIKVQIERVFIVNSKFFHQHDIGDVIIREKLDS